jgi:hypothetical protein
MSTELINEKIGFVILNLTANTDDKILKTIKSVEQHNIFNSTIIFSSDISSINRYDLPILHINQSQFFDGILFLFDLPSIIMTNKFTNLKKRIFYTNSTPWLNNFNTNYKEWSSLYDQEFLQILSGSQENYDIMSICWKQPIGIMENFDYENIKKYI